VLGASLPANEGTIESIFFGTVVNALKSLDANELNDLISFADMHSAALDAGDLATMQQMVSMVFTDMSTPTANPVMTDDIAAEAIVGPVSDLINLVGAGANGSLFATVLLG
jgi:hypothetical protein